MRPSLDSLTRRAIDPRSVRPDGPLTSPRTFGVYELTSPAGTRRFRFGNHPVRESELVAEFGKVKLVYLFRDREDALAAANLLNRQGAG